jgi:branched-chain amino acid transport system ATP-binding protein
MRGDEILGVIGPNGAGKTTLFNVISGFYKPNSGQVRYLNHDITAYAPHRVANLGLVRTFQVDRLFDDLTVVDNLLVACHKLSRPTLLRSLFGGVRAQRYRRDAEKKALDMLELVGMGGRGAELCSRLSHGSKRLISVAMALATGPRIVMLDEPLSGLTGPEVERVLATCRNVRQHGTGVLIVEHNVPAVMSLCDRLVVLNFGRKLAEASPAEIRTDQAVIDAYLGTPDAA